MSLFATIDGCIHPVLPGPGAHLRVPLGLAPFRRALRDGLDVAYGGHVGRVESIDPVEIGDETIVRMRWR